MNKLFCEEQEQTRMSADIVLIYGKGSAREGKCAGFACGNRGNGQRSPDINYARGLRAVHGVRVRYTGFACGTRGSRAVHGVPG